MKAQAFTERVQKLPSELQSAFLDDMHATVEERLCFFERLAKKQAS